MNEESWQSKALQHQKEAAMSELVEVKTGTSIVLDADLLKMGGMGAENVQSKDILIPRLTILQALSPQLGKKKAEYIDGAELGDFCNVATGDVYKEAILVIPCHFATAYIEWTKGRGGLAANHGDDASVLKRCARNDKNQNILPSGNIVEETAQWYCLLQNGADWQRIFFPLKATNLKHSRKWMTLCQTERVQMPNNELWKPPLFWRSWRLVAIEDSNDQGDWVTFRPEKGESTLDIDPNRQLIKMCMSFYEDVRTNVVRGEMEDEHSQTIDGRANKNNDDIPF
jgi:hypothetical protein